MTPTTRETADHAELARLAEAASDNFELPLEEMGRIDKAFSKAFTPAVCSALLSEIAALRGDLTETRVAADLLVSSVRADLRQAERQRDELRKALEPFADEFGEGIPRPDDFQIVGNLNLGHFRRATEALANQGADQ